MSNPPIPSAPSRPTDPVGRRGLFVVFEGGDGAGKSTQSGLLVEALRGAGHEPVVTREPGGTPLGAQIRALLLHGGAVAPRAEALLFAADRAHHVEEVVRPALRAGQVVVSDRYIDSSVAYQGAGRDLPAADIRDLSAWATEGLVPDLTVLLDVVPSTGRARVAGRSGAADRMEGEPDGFHTRVRSHFLALAAADPERYLVLPADDPADAIAAVVLARVTSMLKGSP